jgi:proteasome lid subunit RPN8/RPN11
MREFDAVCLPVELERRLVDAVVARAPAKSFGYLVSDRGPQYPTDFVMFEHNVRNDARWRARFEAYGRYFVAHPSAGFVATPEESWRVQKHLDARGVFEVALFHSHHRHPGSFSGIDYDMHVSRFDHLWHLIVSLRNIHRPQVRAFAVSPAGVRELAMTRDAV